MAIPEYNAAPLAKSWLLTRILTLISLTIIVGLTANFISEIISTNTTPPSEIVSTLAITCLAALYTLISIPVFFAEANLGLLMMAGCDSALLIAFIIVAVVVGKPLSFLNCGILNDANAAANALTASGLAQTLEKHLGQEGDKIGFASWVGVTEHNCYETKAIWGLCVVLCILFFCSVVLLPTMWAKVRRANGSGKSAA